MTDLDDRSDVDSESSDVCVLRDRAETFLVGVLGPPNEEEEERPDGSRF